MIGHSDWDGGQCVLIIHEVEDFEKWKAIFDKAAVIRRQAGELSFQLLVAGDNERRIVHFSRWSSLKAARAFFESDELVAIRKQAGVHAPIFHYLKQIESGHLTDTRIQQPIG